MSTTPRTIAIGSDHGGFDLKERLLAALEAQGYRVDDQGTFKAGVSVDYPVFAYRVARQVASGAADAGIVVDGAGIGSCMAANKVPGIRAAMCYDRRTAENSRAHNDANVLTLGGGMIDEATALEIAEVFLTTECTEPRHRRRAGQILDIERGGLPAEHGPAPSPAPPGDDVTSLSPDDLASLAQQISAILKDRYAAPVSANGARCACCGTDCHGHCAENNTGTVREIIGAGASRISYRPGGRQAVPGDLATYIDHTLLKPDASAEDVHRLCDDARTYEFASVCVNPTFVKLAADLLRNTPVVVCSVVGFPLGAHTPQIKALEARQAIRDGAREIDMVINIGALKSGDHDLLYRDIRAVVEACNDGSALCKVILETSLLTDEEKVTACRTARRARADFVKTSTGFSTGGATVGDVALMAEAVRGSGMGVKASGGIRSRADAVKMIEAGATRIGASASIQIVKGDAPVTASGY